MINGERWRDGEMEMWGDCERIILCTYHLLLLKVDLLYILIPGTTVTLLYICPLDGDYLVYT